MNRRSFLINSAGGIAVLSFAPLYSISSFAKDLTLAKGKVAIKSNSSLLATGDGPKSEYLNPGPFQVPLESPSTLYLWREGQAEVRIPVPLFTHSIAQNPVSPQMVTLIPKWGRRAIEVDLLSGKITRSFQNPEGSRFFGHGFYSDDGKTVFITETNDSEGKSYLSLWEGTDSNAKQIRKVDTYGTRLHECITSKDGKQLVGCNTGWIERKQPSSIVWLDKTDYKLLHKLEFVGEGPSHIYETTDNYFIYGGGFAIPKKHSKVSVSGSVSPDKKLMPLSLPDDQMKFFSGETLSLTANEKSKQAFVTIPSSSSVFIFDYTSGKFIKRLEVAVATGIQISEDRKIFHVTSRKDNSLLTFDCETFKLLDKVAVSGMQGWGSHLIRLKSITA